MRIRKNAKLSPLLFSSSSSSSSWCVQGGSVPVDTHDCLLNQSPWDVISFDSDSIQPDDSFTAGNNNGSAGGSFGALESVASMMDADKAILVADGVASILNIGTTRHMANPCQRVDEKGWPCRKEAKQGQSFCHQHSSFSMLSPNSSNKKSQPQAQAQSSGTGTRRAKTRGAAAGKKGAASTSTNPYEFYYYSGFGPLWGKRRGDRNNGGEGSGNSSVGTENSTMVKSENVVGGAVVDDNVMEVEAVPSVVSEMDHDGIIDYEDDDDEEEEVANEDDSGKKRMRKPVKARSLKSLM